MKTLYKRKEKMVYVYMDSGTSNTRAYLLRDGALLAEAKAPVGTKDSATPGTMPCW